MRRNLPCAPALRPQAALERTTACARWPCATHARDMLFLGRGVNYPIALEGAELRRSATSTPKATRRGDEARAHRAHRQRCRGGHRHAGRVYERCCRMQEAKSREGLIAVALGGRPARGALADGPPVPHVEEDLSPSSTSWCRCSCWRTSWPNTGCDIDQPRNWPRASRSNRRVASTILVTGAAGFIGSHLARLPRAATPSSASTTSTPTTTRPSSAGTWPGCRAAASRCWRATSATATPCAARSASTSPRRWCTSPRWPAYGRACRTRCSTTT